MLSLNALIRSLKTHEIELNEASKESNKKGKSITLKSIQRRSSTSKAMKASEEIDERKELSNDEDDKVKDEIAHLAEKITRVWIRKKKKKGVTPKVDKKRKAKQNEIICFEWKETKHLSSECPKLKKSSRKKAPKKKAMMAT